MNITDEEIRIKVAEAHGTMRWSYALPTKCIGASVPNYPKSLDACAEFEETLTGAEWGEYGDNILLLSLGPVRMVSQINKAKINAKPRIKCLAYLKVKGILP